MSTPRKVHSAASHRCYIPPMPPRELTQRELRNRSGEIMRALDRGESFIVTRRGVPVAELKPIARRRQFVNTAVLMESLRKLPPIDYEQFRADVDAYVDQDPTPRG